MKWRSIASWPGNILAELIDFANKRNLQEIGLELLPYRIIWKDRFCQT